MPQNLNEEAVRIDHLNAIKAAGVDAYPARCARTHTLAQAHESPADTSVTVVGRIITIRTMGKLCFAHLRDDSGKMQIAVSEKELGSDKFKFFVKNLEMGDFVQATGVVFTTHKGEISVLVKEYSVLSKALLPLPEKFHGLSNIETRYRQRYLDLISNDEAMRIAKVRSLLVREIRNYFDAQGFYEVETPILQTLYGGALAKPFATHHNALDIPLYLRIAPELYLKRLIVGGFEKMYEVARCFRNEGIDHNHNPEFTQIEFYWAYADYNKLMDFVEKMLPHIITAAGLPLKFTAEGQEVDFTPPYPRVSMRELIKKYAKIDIEDYPDQAAMFALAKKLKVEGAEPGTGRGKLIDEIYKMYARTKIVNPIFMIDHPVELSPLAKKKPTDPRYVERFQLLCVGGNELMNAFSELNDPTDQEERFKEQTRLADAGDEESMPYDEDYVTALKHGMPPTAGLGMGIDRLVKLLVNADNLKEVILFPTLKPAHLPEVKNGKSKTTLAAHALILDTSDEPYWSKLNTVAHLSASLGAREGKKLIYIDSSKTTDGISIPMNIQHAIVMKKATNQPDLLTLKRDAEKNGLIVTCFTEDMRNSSDDKKVKMAQESKSSDKIKFLGILIFGNKKIVEKLTDKFPLA